jgi:hypothetical protein
MARPSKLTSMSVEALIKMRDDVAAALGQKADALKKVLASLGSDHAQVGRVAVHGKKKTWQAAKCPSSTGTRLGTPGQGVGLSPAG